MQVKSKNYYNSYPNVIMHKPLLEKKLMVQVAQQQIEDTQNINPTDLKSIQYKPHTKNDGIDSEEYVKNYTTPLWDQALRLW